MVRPEHTESIPRPAGALYALRNRWRAACLVAAVLAVPAGAAGAELPAVASPGACEQLLHRDFTGIAEAPMRILSASVIEATGKLPEYCRVTGYIQPQIQFEVRLPTRIWNGRYLQAGCGGFCGAIHIDRGNDALSRGFTVAANNMGHVSGADGLWGSDHDLRRDYGLRSTHAMAVAARQLIDALYDRKADYAYFQGCSTGGREGLNLALHHPEDFQGIIAGDPAFPSRQGGIMNNWIAHHLNTDAGKPVFSEDKLAMLHDAVLAECDTLDGLQDGVIADPRACTFDVRKLACPAGSDGPGCLTAAQVDAAQALYDGPRDGQGRRLYPGWVVFGSELSWNAALNANYATEFLKYLAFPENPPDSYSYRDFDFATDVPKLEEYAAVYDPVAPHRDPDLSAYRAAGGKLIVYHGWADATVSPLTTLDFYSEITQQQGGVDAVQDWYRVFMFPGMQHCRGGGVPDKADWLGAIMNWVEADKAPDRIVATQYGEGGIAAGKTVRTRPLYPYPAVARYSGSGDLDDAANWESSDGEEHDDDIHWIWDPD